MSGISYRASREISLDLLSDGKPRPILEVSKRTGLTRSMVDNALGLAWRRGLVARAPGQFLNSSSSD